MHRYLVLLLLALLAGALAQEQAVQEQKPLPVGLCPGFEPTLVSGVAGGGGGSGDATRAG